MNVPARFPDGTDGVGTAYDAGVLSVLAPRAYAPGAPIALTLDDAQGPIPLSGKTIGSRRTDDGRFLVRLRLTNLRRDQRERLEALSTPN